MINGKKKHLGTEAILNRWNTQGCANCQIHQEVKTFFNLPQPAVNELNIAQEQNTELRNDVVIELKGRNGLHLTSEPITVTYAPVQPSVTPAENKNKLALASLDPTKRVVNFLSVNEGQPKKQFSIIRKLFYKKEKTQSGAEASFGIHIQ